MRDEGSTSLDYAAHRAAMVQHQLRARGIKDQRVLAAMGRVPREAFVPKSLEPEAYFDCALPRCVPTSSKSSRKRPKSRVSCPQ